MNARTAYIFLSILGFVLPYWHFVPWVVEHGLDIPLFIRTLFSNPIGGFFGMDVVVAAAALVTFILVEGRRLKMQRQWLPIAVTFLVGVSCGLPLFLYIRHPYACNTQDVS